MQASVDNRVIDRRIGELCKEWMHVNGRNDVATNLQATLQAVFDEGLTANRGGKRLRALLALAAFDAYGVDNVSTGKISKETTTQNGNANTSTANHDTQADGIPPAMLDLACAIEIYQTSALIHDDIIDDSPLRRGRPSAHVALAGKNEGNGPDNFGTGLALMLGNMLATASADIAATALENPALQYADENLHTFLQMQRAVEIGQTLDLGAENISLDEPDKLIDASLNVFAWKTASYTTIAPLGLGLCAAGMAPKEAHQAARGIGLPLGVAFQLADDLIDVTGKNSGKPVGGDVREGKRTVLLADALQAADKTGRDTLINTYHKPTRSDTDVRNVLDLFVSTGAIDASRRRIQDLCHKTESAIDRTIKTPESHEILAQACERFIPDNLR
ncbi:polyprenyl synthetase family protein [Bifidobacterium sp. ESL0728]|uniref:polyprenyl synthetase family protein n=1 Tax=Bifidobacterium sp. ESL0728 TaxID=2983220 RepID=UPI0023F815FD|nr:polyprenyl synthetase family protein [Bifidobacterium sp. ESL0728]WEV58454.1 polyprenyl synthetase family protein [Bifidobacterium sp. ESL0728]